MTILLLAMLVQPDSARQALDRYRDFMTASPAIDVRFTVKEGQRPPAACRLQMHLGKSMRLDSKWNASDYTYVITKGGYMRELERSLTLYDEVEANAPFSFPDSDISTTPAFVMPTFFGARDLKALYGEEGKMTDLGESTINGIVAHGVRFQVDTMMGPEFGEFAIDSEGRLVQARRFGGSLQNRDAGRIWDFAEIKKIDTVPAEVLQLQIPSGYVPYRLPEVFGPAPIGAMFPFENWKGGKSIQKGVRTLYVLTGEECPPSEASLGAIEELNKTGLVTRLLIDVTSVDKAKGRAFDPTGKSIGALMAPATPVFYLVGTDGKIERLWMGYDPSKRKSFIAEVKESIKELATK